MRQHPVKAWRQESATIGRQALSLMLALTSSSLSAQSDIPNPANGKNRSELRSEVTEPTRSQKSKSIDFTEMAQLQVVVKDASGNAISEASVMPYAMRVIEQNGHGFWDAKKLGPPRTEITDEQGLATIHYPIHVDGTPDVLTTRQVTFRVRHLEFVEQVVHFDLGPARAEVTLEPGCEVQLSAVNERGEPITEFGVLMAGPFASDLWTTDGQSGKRTRSIKDGKWQTMLVKLQDDGPTLFSNVLPLPVRPSQAVRIRNIQLSPGARIAGRLGDEVPRPIKNGKIISAAIPMPAASSYAPEDPSLVWHESTSISEAGQFELPSVPRGGEMQIIALCDGWISKTTMEGANKFFIMGQLFEVNENQISLSVQMERTGTLEVTVVAPNGLPLEGARVVTWPNQLYYKGGSTILGMHLDSKTIVANQSLPAERQELPKGQESVDGFSGTTDQQGKAIINGIPVGREQSLELMHPDYCLPKKEGERMQRYNLASPDGQHLQIVVEAISAVEVNAK